MKKGLLTPAIYLLFGLVPVALWKWPVLLSPLSDGEGLHSFLSYLSFAALAGTGFMGWRLNQTRILLASAVYLVLCAFLRNAVAPPFAVLDTLSIALPFSLALMAAGVESPLADRRFAQRAGLALLPFAAFGALAAGLPGAFARLADWAPWGWGRPFGLPWAAAAAAAGCWAVAALPRDQRTRPFMLALASTLVPYLFALVALASPDRDQDLFLPRGFHMMTACAVLSLILLHAVFSLYWHRVYVDELTGLPNRRALDEKMGGLGGSYSIAMMDIDLFKSYNDEFGHDQGDEILRMAGGHIARELGGRAYRYGGEEFCAIFEGFSPDSVSQAVENCRKSLDARVFRIRAARPNPLGPTLPHIRKGLAVGVSISAGVAHSAPGLAPADVLKRADEALYAAKRAGRNRVVAAG